MTASTAGTSCPAVKSPLERLADFLNTVTINTTPKQWDRFLRRAQKDDGGGLGVGSYFFSWKIDIRKAKEKIAGHVNRGI
jgi:hypothetical protein